MDILRKDNYGGDVIFYNYPLTGEQMTCGLKSSVSQRLVTRLKTFKGEWFMDNTYGFPYFQEVLGKKINKEDVDNIYRREILKERGVKNLTYFKSTLSKDRVYKLEFRISVGDGVFSDVIGLEVDI